MATSVIRNFLFQAPGPRYLTLVPQHHHHTPSTQEFLEKMEEMQEEREEREDEAEAGEEMEDDDDDDDDVDCESEGPEEEEEESECLEMVVLAPPQPTVDMTRQLLRFADLISNDVRRYFGRGAGTQESDTHGDSLSVTSSGRLRYYDDLLKIARTGSPADQEVSGAGPSDGEARGALGLGPLAELFDHSRLTQGCSRPMVKRHLPLSFWTEPMPCCSESTDTDKTTTYTQGGTRTNLNTHEHYAAHAHAETHALDNAHPDFSDLLAHWDPNPELPHSL